jgi:hypothetical protein
MTTQTTKKEAVSKRNRAGRYTFDGNWSRLCACGQPLGMHTDVAPHTIDDDLGLLGGGVASGVHHNCAGFKLARRQTK